MGGLVWAGSLTCNHANLCFCAHLVGCLLPARHTNITAAYHFVTWSNSSGSATDTDGCNGSARQGSSKHQQVPLPAPAGAVDEVAAGRGAQQVAINSGWLAVPVQPSAAGVETVGHCNSHIHSGMNNNASDTSHTCSAQLVQGPTNSPYQQELNSQLQHSHAAQQQQQQQQNMDGHHPQEGQQQDQDQVENDSQQQTSFIPCSPNMFHRNLPSLPQQQQQQQGQQQPEQEPEAAAAAGVW